VDYASGIEVLVRMQKAVIVEGNNDRGIGAVGLATVI
jgi:hypothetical protein